MRTRASMALAIALIATFTGAAAAAVTRSDSARLPPPAFRSSPIWVTVTTGPTNPARVAPQVWAITARGNVSALRPFDLFNGLQALSRDGIVVWASTGGRGTPTRVFTPARWPLVLTSFRVDRSWEGQPSRNVQQRLRWATVRGWHLDVRVYFATQHPSRNLLRQAQAEIDRMLLPRSG